jgi:hypothetical protein
MPILFTPGRVTPPCRGGPRAISPKIFGTEVCGSKRSLDGRKLGLCGCQDLVTGLDMDLWWIKWWVWVNTYRYITIVGWTSINPSYDLGFTRYQGFDPLPYDKMIFLELRFMKWVDQPLCNWRKKLETPAIPQTAAMAWFQPRVWFENAHPLYTHWKWHIQGFPEFSL